jgi:pyrroloquinoline quinone (PQQ) biosynthesis protein C
MDDVKEKSVIANELDTERENIRKSQDTALENLKSLYSNLKSQTSNLKDNNG